MRSPAGALAALAFAVVGFLGPAALPAAEDDVLLREEFSSLDAWRPLTFPKIERHSTYSIGTNADQSGSWLRAESDRSASGVVWKKQYDVYEYPRLRWRWRVENVYQRGDATKKSGDDYPLRVYVIFQYDPARASAGKRLKYGFAKAVYGEYPPDSGLNYIWESRDNPSEFVVSPYTGSMMMFLKEKGTAKVGQWVEEEADVLGDYRRAFGKDPPRRASLAVMNDSDNTGEKGISFIDWIEISR
ncbi:MAG: DUF3047 domain-containing protein [Candidatus Methylomirabilia bacterium]